MVGDDWIGGASWGEALPATDNLPANRKLVVVVCCPSCSSFDAGRKDWREGDQMAYWQCRACDHRWKEPMAVGNKKIRAAIP